MTAIKTRQRRRAKGSNPFAFPLLLLFFGGVFWWGLNESLYQMTYQDCHINKITEACASLKK
tara:strand:- start:671 stop:856 length:186 start_codon:yes stop_codon:yes gene_type:complete